jgi:acyl-coenzyme A synthetase/AMP-(fatty) acid ligase
MARDCKDNLGSIKDIKTLIFGLPGTYFTGDGALRDEVGYYRTGRVDDIIVFRT